MQANSTIALLESINLYHINSQPTNNYKVTKNLSSDLCCSSDECSICLNKIAPNNHITDCGHKYHINCLDLWLKQGADTCPVCRTRLESTDLTEQTPIGWTGLQPSTTRYANTFTVERTPAFHFLGNYGNGPNSRTVYYLDNQEENFVGDPLHLVISD